LLDVRERILPELDDDFAKSVGEVQTVDELRTEIRDALAKRAEAEARHAYADRIIDFASSNATVELPEVMISNEIEIMRDELANRLAQQRIGLDQYLALAKQTPEELTAELREPASRRVKVLLVLSAIAEREGIDASLEEVQAEIDDQLARYANDSRLAESLGSRRGRSYLRMTIRNRKLVDTLVERALGTDASAAAAATSASEEAKPEPTQE
jgi:trigger factor